MTVNVWIGKYGPYEVPSELCTNLVFTKSDRVDERFQSFKRLQQWAEEMDRKQAERYEQGQ